MNINWVNISWSIKIQYILTSTSWLTAAIMWQLIKCVREKSVEMRWRGKKILGTSALRQLNFVCIMYIFLVLKILKLQKVFFYFEDFQFLAGVFYCHLKYYMYLYYFSSVIKCSWRIKPEFTAQIPRLDKI